MGEKILDVEMLGHCDWQHCRTDSEHNRIIRPKRSKK